VSFARDELREWASLLKDRPGVVNAAALELTPGEGIDALLVLSVSSPPPEVTLPAWISMHLGGAAAEVTESRLPVGRALRVHRTGEPGPGDPEGRVVETVGYAFRAPDGDVVWHEMIWEGRGDHRFCDVADRIAAGLVFS
jgi:hypothetical protein